MSADVFYPGLLDSSKTCRLCLQQSVDLCPLFPETEPTDSTVTSLPSKIMACVSIEVLAENTMMPKQICSKCVQQIDCWIKFKELCLSANAFLQQCLANVQSSTNFESEKRIKGRRSSSSTALTTTNNIEECEGVDSSKSYIVIVKEETCDESRVNNVTKLSEAVEQKVVNKVHVSDNSIKHKDKANTSKWKAKYDRYQKKRYICGLNSCNSSFSRFCDLIQHDRLEHEEVPVDKSCSTCGKTFINENRLKVHSTIYHSEKKYSCEICSGKFLSKASLRSHMKRHTGQWVCSECGLRTSSNIALMEHKRKHSGDKPFICDTCGRSYTTKTSLNSHKQTHTKEFPFKCNLCAYSAPSHSSMRKHKVKHTSEKDCICEICGKMFKLKSGLEEHRKTHTLSKQYICDVCKTAFASKYKLMLHTRVHSGERPFTCDTCNKQFARRDALKQHARTHTGEKKYACKNCPKQFSFLKSLKNHKCLSNVDISKTSTTDSQSTENDIIEITTESVKEEIT